MPSSSKPFVIDNCLSIKTASGYSGYIHQYLRRLLRLGKLAGTKIGQVWLIEMVSIKAYLVQTQNLKDNRFGTKYC